MKNTTKIFSIIFSFLLLISSTLCVFAQNTYNRLDDKADLLTTEEESQITDLLNKVEEKHGIKVIILTTDKISEYTDMDTSKYPLEYMNSLAVEYSRNYYISQGFTSSTDGIILLRYINEYDFYISITPYGDLDKVFDESISNNIIDEIEHDLRRGSNTFCEGLTTYINLVDETYDSRNDLTFGSIAIALIISLVISLIIVLNMKSKLKSVTNQNFAKEYLKKGSFKLTSSKDTYLYRTVTKVRIQSNSSSGGRSGGGGGRSGGAGRRS
jgi:uncharacterized protein